MIRPLIWKELRESRAAAIVGALWVLGAVLFWQRAYGIQFPAVIDGLAHAITALAPLICMILLSVGRFHHERDRGTWDFIRTRPVTRRRIVAAKWAVGIGLGVAFMALSSAIAWWPLGRIEDWIARVSLGRWVLMHVASAGLLMSLLLLIDTLDWGEWMALRVGVTAGAILWFLISIYGEPLEWSNVARIGLTASACAAVAIAFAPVLAGETPLPHWRWQFATRMRRFSHPHHAWLWSEWRRVSWIVALLILWLPMCLAITVINSRIILGPNSTWSALPGILDLVAGAVPFAILAAATSLGCLGIARMADGAEPMRRTLPLAHRKVLLWNLGLSLTLFAACASVPWAIHLAAELSVRGRVTDLLTDSLLAGTALLIGWHAATPIEPRLLPIAAIAAMIYTANLLYSSPPSMLALFTVLIGTLLLLPLSARLAWRREV